MPTPSHNDGSDIQKKERGRSSNSFIIAGTLCKSLFIVLYLNTELLITIKGLPIHARNFLTDDVFPMPQDQGKARRTRRRRKLSSPYIIQ